MAELVLVQDSVHSSWNGLLLPVLSYSQAFSSRLVDVGRLPRTYGWPMVVLNDHHLCTKPFSAWNTPPGAQDVLVLGGDAVVEREIALAVHSTAAAGVGPLVDLLDRPAEAREVLPGGLRGHVGC